MDNRYGMKIASNIYMVAWWDIVSDDDPSCDVYAIDCQESVVLIDAGLKNPYPGLKENLKHWGLWDRVSLCLLTHLHPDHAGAVEALRADGIKVLCGQGYEKYKKETEAREFWNGQLPDLDGTVSDGDRIKIGNIEFEVVSTPGHTSLGTTYIATIDSKRYAFTGDLFMPGGTIGFSGSFDFDKDRLLDSLKHLLEYDFDAALTGHYVKRSQPEGLWLEDGKSHLIDTYKKGLDGMWNIQKAE